MSFINYLSSSLRLYEEIYKLVSNMSCIPNDNNEDSIANIRNNYTLFKKLQSEYCDMVSSQINQSITFEPECLKDYIRIQNNGHHYMTIKLTFYIDNPNLNEYGIIVELQNVEKHYKFKQISSNSSEHKIKLATDLYLLFSDDLVDEIRGGKIQSNGRFIISFETNLFPVLRLPFHPEYISNNRDWCLSVLNSMDVELESFQKKTKKNKKINTIIKTLYN